MGAIEHYKPTPGVLPQDEYFRLVSDKDKSIPQRLLKNFSDIPANATGDIFGQIYQYFLAEIDPTAPISRMLSDSIDSKLLPSVSILG